MPLPTIDRFAHQFRGMYIKSLAGLMKFMPGKETYIIKAFTEETADPSTGLQVFQVVVVCDQRFVQGESPDAEIAVITAHIQNYIDNYDNDEDNRDTKLRPAASWKKEQLILSGVDLTDAVERKVWQDRSDLLTDAEKDALITAWEAS